MYFDDLSNQYILLDIEGNSASKIEERKITQFAALVIQNGKIQKEVNWMNRNVNLIHPYVSKMTHISLHQCKEVGFSERHLIHEIYQLLKNCQLIYAYGCDFDKNILNFMFKKYNYKPLTIPWVDVIEDVKKYLNPSKFKLSIAANEYGFQDSHFHNALVDCHATLHLMKTIENIIQVTQI